MHDLIISCRHSTMDSVSYSEYPLDGKIEVGNVCQC